jgi:hypothetical protein
MTLLAGAQACEFCDGITGVRVCSGHRINGEPCPNRMCVLHSCLGPKGPVCPECRATSPADLEQWTKVPFERTDRLDLLVAFEQTVGLITSEEGGFAIDCVQPPTLPPR